MPDLNPLHYLIVIGAIIMALMGADLWMVKAEFRVCTAEHEAFIAKTKAEGEESLRETENREHLLAQAATNIQEDLNHAKDNLNRAYAANERLRLDAKRSAGSVKTVYLADAASRLNCPDRSADLAGRLEQIEAGNVRLLKRGDEAILRTIACKKYVDSLKQTLKEQQP